MKNSTIFKSIICVLFFYTITVNNSVFAQSEFGIKVGLFHSNIRKLSSQKFQNFEYKNGLNLGLYYQKQRMVGRFGLQMELNYQQKGALVFIKKIEPTGSGYSGNGSEYGYAIDSWYRDSEKLHYINVPLLVTFQVSKNIELFAGPEINYLFALHNQRQEVKLKRITFGAVGGVALKLGERNKLDLRYSTDLMPYDQLSAVNGGNLKNHGFAITLKHSLFRK